MKFERELLKGIAPVVTLEILSRGAMYGYELSQAIEQRSGDILSLGKGTLYPLLTRMEGRGWLKCKVDPKAGLRARKEYSLTGKGRQVLRLLRRQLEELHREVVLGEDGDRGCGP